MPDNICASPRGGLVVCEDGDDGDPPMRLQCLTREGLLMPFCINNINLSGNPVNGFQRDYRDSEWAGASFSRDGTTLFVNIQRPGISVAITGPWKSGLL
jgi:secreted PhoX family phosphatase